jgi:hypothetical protein
MRTRRSVRAILISFVFALAVLGRAPDARAQAPSDESRWFADVAVGITPSVNGNINSGAIGTLNGQATAILPHSYGDVYGTGIDFRFGGGYTLSPNTEVRGMFVWQTADADLVQLGQIGVSNLYVQYSDYKSLGLDFGYRRYFRLSGRNLRPYGEATIGAAFIDRINAQFAAPGTNNVFNSTDFYDQSAALTFGINFGALFPVGERWDFNFQLGLRSISGLSQVDQLTGTGLQDINDNTGRVTFPIVVGARFRFR